MNERRVLSSYVYQMVASLVQAGVEDVVISPGSRSTPLAYAFANTKDLNVFRQIDERSAGFFALGLAKATAKPVVLLCTSGTAAANYYPAIVEAKYARVPLIVITADRPHELREVGAPQAINQVHLYGEHVKWSVDFPIPDGAKQTLPFIERHMARAISIAMSAPFGPVHVNVPFREPLLIDFMEKLSEPTFRGSFVGEIVPSEEAKKELTELLRITKQGFVIIGELPLGTEKSHLWEFIRQLKWPVLVESLSNMRTNVPEDCMQYVISTYDAILRSEHFKERVEPQTVIRFGAQPVSKFLNLFITASMPENYIIVDEDPMFRDASSMATNFIHASIGEWITTLDVADSEFDVTYLAEWQDADDLAIEYISHYADGAIDEGAMVSRLLEFIPEGSDVFVSSSMPIRDIDTFLLKTERDIQVFANRGTNGIDGVVSTALGFSSGRNRACYLIIGDLAFLHDMSGLTATRYQDCELTILVMNNDGGGIFSYLPQSTVEAHYEDLFGTPTDLEFEEIANMYEMEYFLVEQLDELFPKFAAEQLLPMRLIEILTDREENVYAHRALWQQINTGLKAWQS